MILYFARHGESVANVSRTFSNRDPWHPLTPTGERQACELACAMRATEIDAIYASPAVRAQQTAGVIAESKGLTVRVAEALREYDVGELEGTDSESGWREVDEVVAAWSLGDYARSVSTGETLTQILSRFADFLDGLRDAHPPAARALVVGHGGLYRAVFPVLFDNVDFAWALSQPLGHCSIVVAEMSHSAITCRRWGDLVL